MLNAVRKITNKSQLNKSIADSENKKPNYNQYKNICFNSSRTQNSTERIYKVLII